MSILEIGRLFGANDDFNELRGVSASGTAVTGCSGSRIETYLGFLESGDPY